LPIASPMITNPGGNDRAETQRGQVERADRAAQSVLAALARGGLGRLEREQAM